jgi:leader peptidase (prepilin peptidase)/N-methyltransferase
MIALGSILFVIVGLVVGSFLTSLTYRYPRNISFTKGRSKCPKCKKTIKWFDNIPILSFVLLAGRCRFCNKKISIRYPLIEFCTGLGFFLVYFFFKNCAFLGSSVFCYYSSKLGFWAIPFFLVIISILIAIFVIDLEKQMIPDSLVFMLYLIITSVLILMQANDLYLYFLSGFALASFLLFLHLITKGKGMGLGDVKFVLASGTLLGWPMSISFLFLAFLTGGLVGSILILLGKSKFGKKIAFGPFLVISLIITLVLERTVVNFVGLY